MSKSKRSYKYIYGPVPSWRLGRSLGIDPISRGRKVCSFDCVYCQLKRTRVFTDERDIYVPVSAIVEEVISLPSLEIDYITFSGTGEPTLAQNLGQMIEAVRKIKKEKIAVLTNSSLLDRKDVQDDLSLVDFVVAKLDANSQETFEIINRPLETIKFDTVVEGIKSFRKIYKGKLALQIMFVEGNKMYASEIARIARDIGPDEVQINTPLRPCGVKPLPRQELAEIKSKFTSLNAISVYEAPKKYVQPISDEDTLSRRGKVT